MKVMNRADGATVYSLPEFRVRRVFEPGEVKEIPPKELNALWQMAGGKEIIIESLMVQDKDWVEEHWDAPLEYFWGPEEIKTCLLEDSLDLFTETLDLSPQGVLDIMKRLAWQLPLSDLNKMKAMEDHPRLLFDVLAAIDIMSTVTESPQIQKKTERLRKA